MDLHREVRPPPTNLLPPSSGPLTLIPALAPSPYPYPFPYPYPYP